MTIAPIDRLTLLYHISQNLNSSLDLDEVLDRAMDEVIAAVHAERGFLMLAGVDGGLEFKVARGLDQHTIAAPEFQVSRGLVERVAREGQPLLTSDAQSDAWLRSRASVAGLGLRSILCVPLQLKGVTRGVIYVDNRLRAGIFGPADLDLLSAIAATAAIAIENARLYQLAVEKGRLERELQVAREVQHSLLPHEMPVLPGWEIAARWQPARVVSGDFYDCIPDLAGRQRLSLVVGDVSDKGMPAALFMASTRSILRGSVAGGRAPGEALANANRLLCADAINGMFVTLCYVVLDSAGDEIVYVNAGHNPPLVCRGASGDLVALGRTGLILGVAEDQVYDEGRLALAVGDYLVLYTDGLTEALNERGEEFGEERLRACIQQCRNLPAAEFVQALSQTHAGFTGSSAPFDDITVLVARRVPVLC
jgi:phosphoserine phosphatase RsbU/P